MAASSRSLLPLLIRCWKEVAESTTTILAALLWIVVVVGGGKFVATTSTRAALLQLFQSVTAARLLSLGMDQCRLVRGPSTSLPMGIRIGSLARGERNHDPTILSTLSLSS